MENEDFVSDSELVSYFNDALSDCEAIIMGTRQDYFLTSAKLDNGSLTPGLVSGQSLYNLPADIYANKIREIVYNDGSKVYEIKPLRSLHKFARVADENNYATAEDFLKFIILNKNTTDGMQLQLIPTPLETNNYVDIWYVRSAERLPDVPVGTEVVDIPEFYTYFKAAVKAKCAMKEGHPRIQMLLGEWQYYRQQMLDTLTEQVATDDNEVLMDLSHYANHS